MKLHTLLMSACLSAAVLATPASANQVDAGSYDDDLREMLEVLRSDLNSHKVEVINAALKLSDEEAEIFWPIYKAYEVELAELVEDKLRLIGDYYQLYYADAKHDDSWDAVADRSIRGRQNRLALWQEYHGKISAALSPYRAAQFLQLEGQIALLVDLSIASELPNIGAPETTASLVPTKIEAVKVKMSATVDGIDHDNRVLVLRGDHDKLTTLNVHDDVERFDEIELGDLVSVEYQIAVVAELRAPTVTEIEEPLVILAGGAKTDETAAPTAGVGRVIRAVCTIEGLDRQSQMVSLKGPMGKYFSVKASDPKRLTQVSIGDTVVITYCEALAIGIEKL